MDEQITQLYDFFQELRADRGSKYGHFGPNMRATSLQLQGLWEQYQACNPGAPVPAWWAPLTQVAVKLNRTAGGTYLPDNAIDGSHYWAQTLLMQKGCDNAKS